MANVVEYKCEICGGENDLILIADLISDCAAPVRGKCVDLIVKNTLAGVGDFGIDIVDGEIGRYDWLKPLENGVAFRGACDGSIVQFCEAISMIFDVSIRLYRRDWESDWCESRQFKNGGWRVVDCYREDVRADDEPLEWAVRNGEIVDSAGKAVLV